MANEPFYYVLTSKWLGAAFYWAFSGFKGKYADQLLAKNDSRNIWTGYAINLIFLIGIFYWIFF